MKKGSLYTLGSASFLAISSLFSQILGFLRDKLLSYIYGASFALDSYYASFRVPEFMYLSVGSFVSSAILVPLFAKKLHDDDARVWFQKLFTTFAVFFIFVYGIVALVLPKIVAKLYSHTNAEFQNSIVLYGSILLVSTFFLSLSSIISSVAQEGRDFLRVGLAPIMYNLGTVLGIVVLRPMWGIVGVCIGVVGGSMMHLFIQMPQVKKMGLFHGYGKFVYKAFSFDLLKKTLNKSFLRTLSLMASAVTFFLLTYFASRYESGSITIITIAFTLQTVSHTLIGVSYATVILPALSDAFVNKKNELFDSIMRNGFKKIFLISFVLTGIILVFQKEIVYVLFGGGKFSPRDVYLTAVALGLFTVSLYAQNAILLISRASYAIGDYVLPLVVNSITAILTYVFATNFYNSSGMLHSVWSVPLAYSLAQYIALFVGTYIHGKHKTIKDNYIHFKYAFGILFIITITSVAMRHMLSLILVNAEGRTTHIVYSSFIFLSYIVIAYVLLGTIKDEHIKEHRQYLKNKIKSILLALLGKRG